MGEKIFMIVIKQEHLKKIQRLFDSKINDAYVTLYDGNEYRTICQYSSKYGDCHIVNVKYDSLVKANKTSLD